MASAALLPKLLLLLLLLVATTTSQPTTPRRAPAPASPAPPPPPPPQDSCVGVFLSYQRISRTRIHPILPSDPSNQPFSFHSIATVLNTDSVPLTSWSLHIPLPNRTVLVSASNAIPADSSTFPFIVSNGTGVSFIGSSSPDLKTAIETAGDLSQIQVQIELTGTDFGVFKNPPLPSSISLDNPGFICPKPTSPSGNTSFLYTCCTRDPKFRPNSSISDPVRPRLPGDISIIYDVLQSYEATYLALVTIDNLSPLGRLDNWRLNWTWTGGEFITKMRGAHPTIKDPSECIYGKQGQFYKDFDLSSVLNCQPTPTIVDLPVSMFNNTDFGRIPSCCRNGTILPKIMDETQSRSSFQLEVRKMPPHMNRTDLTPPLKWHIWGSENTMNPTYNCSAPIRVTPSMFPDPSGLPTSASAIASWQVVCNITVEDRPPRCCVSFSGFYNDSVVPCKTCACGCPKNVDRTCSISSKAMLLPPEALLVPFDNRTLKARAWAEIKHYNVPNPLPCGDYCGVSINWHVYTDYRGGWSARITLFNWEDSSIADWFAAVEMKKAYAGYEGMYSFNGTAIGNNTIFMKGLPGLNYLVKENGDVDPKDPGKMQTVISFSKKKTPGIDVLGGDGFPSKVVFNGEVCSLPDVLPKNHAFRSSSLAGGLLGMVLSVLMSVVVLMGL